MREHLSQCASPPFRGNELRNVNKQFADRLRVNTTKTIHFGRLHLHDISFWDATSQVLILDARSLILDHPVGAAKWLFMHPWLMTFRTTYYLVNDQLLTLYALIT